MYCNKRNTKYILPYDLFIMTINTEIYYESDVQIYHADCNET